jgi:phospholipase/carboxylesterase
MSPNPHLHLPPSGKAELLFVLLHGGGAAPEQMQPLADALRAQYPQAALALLQAPHALPSDAVRGFIWYDETDAVSRAPAAVAALVTEVRRLAAELQLDWPRVALAGFSQGGLLALEAVQTEPKLVGRVLAFGAAPLGRPVAAPEGVCLHLLHGLADAEVPYRHVVDAAQTWVELGADITADVLPDVGHSLDARLIERGMEQLRTFIPSRLWREAVSQAAEMEESDRAALKRPH